MFPDTIQAEPTVRNTFIDVHIQHSSAQRRNKSLPPSFAPAIFALQASGKQSDSGADDSTDVHTEASSDDMLDLLLLEVQPSADGCNLTCQPCDAGYPADSCTYNLADTQALNSWGQQLSPEQFWPQQSNMPEQDRPRLNSKAVAFQPGQQPMHTRTDDLDNVVQMVKVAGTILERCQRVASVDVSHDAFGAYVVVAPSKESPANADHVLSLAKRALIQAAEKSKDVYVLCYECPDRAFTSKPHGFEAQLAVMADSRGACWRMFKQGCCSYGATCKKDHPVLQMPVRIFVESARFQSATPPDTIQHYKQEFANFMMLITALVSNSCGVAAYLNDLGGEGFAIEIPLHEDYLHYKEHFLQLAQDAFMEASRRSKQVFVMGSGAQPFVPKSNGFVAMLGEMMDRNQACWDVYKDGLCSREHACRWQHPQILLPASVVIKTESSTADETQQ